jgi:hypothetical protein
MWHSSLDSSEPGPVSAEINRFPEENLADSKVIYRERVIFRANAFRLSCTDVPGRATGRVEAGRV